MWLANAGALTTRCQRAVNNYSGWCFTGLLISISEIDSLKPDYQSFAIASRRRWCPRNFANSLWKEFDISSVLFGKVFLKPKCKNQVPWPDQPDNIFPLPLVWRSQINSPSKPYISNCRKKFKIAPTKAAKIVTWLFFCRSSFHSLFRGFTIAWGRHPSRHVLTLLDIDGRQWKDVKIGYG